MLLDRIAVQQSSLRVQSNLRFAGLQEDLSSQSMATRCVAQQCVQLGVSVSQYAAHQEGALGR